MRWNPFKKKIESDIMRCVLYKYPFVKKSIWYISHSDRDKNCIWADGINEGKTVEAHHRIIWDGNDIIVFDDELNDWLRHNDRQRKIEKIRSRSYELL